MCVKNGNEVVGEAGTTRQRGFLFMGRRRGSPGASLVNPDSLIRHANSLALVLDGLVDRHGGQREIQSPYEHGKQNQEGDDALHLMSLCPKQRSCVHQRQEEATPGCLLNGRFNVAGGLRSRPRSDPTAERRRSGLKRPPSILQKR